MEFLNSIFVEHSALQAIIVLSLITAAGMLLSKVPIRGISLGVTFVFFVGILAGHFGLSIDPQMLSYAESFGLVLFVYELGLQVGPGFFSSFRKGGIKLNGLALCVIILGTAMSVILAKTLSVPMGDMIGILCGATTNTPALGAAQEMLKQLGLPTSGATLGCAVTYPLGVVGVILAMMAIRKLFVRESDIDKAEHEDHGHTFVATYHIGNKEISGKSLMEIASMGYPKFVVSRLWRGGKVSIPTSGTIIMPGDKIMVVTNENAVHKLEELFGQQDRDDWNKEDIDWNAIDSRLISQHIVISRPEINGKTLGSLHLRNAFGINISRVMRSGVRLLATPSLVLQFGDRLTVVGEADSVHKVEAILGNSTKELSEPNLAAIYIGVVLGLVIGSIPILIPGMSTPVKLGLAGGPIIVGILIGSIGPRLRLVTYTTRSANLMLRGIGISLYLACLGLDAGEHFFETIMRPEGLMWVGIGFVLTFVPVVLMGFLAMRLNRLDFGSVCGMLCGSMANPMALSYANDTLPGDNPAVSYATVYPFSMFVRVITAQVVLMLFL